MKISHLKSQMGPSFWAVLAVVVAASLLRLLPHPPNFSPIGAMALFGGAFLAHPVGALLLPVGTLFLTDLALGFHDHVAAVYLSVMLVSILGLGLKKNASAGRVLGRAVVGSVIFFVVTNFAVWAQSGFFPMTFEGLVQCYTVALPFFQNTLAGDLAYSTVFFGAWALARRFVFSKASSSV